MLRRIVLGAAMLAASTAALDAQGVPGELRCNLAGGIGLVVASSRAITCVYYRPDGAVEFYAGAMRRVGLDLGPASARSLAYRVMTDHADTPAALQGDFEGVGAGATLGEGLSADALVGGQGVTLVPVANASITGLNVYGGLGSLHLDYAGSEPGRRHPLR